jgi:hypothetical protein
MENNFQRLGSISNTHVGREFEEAARLFFAVDLGSDDSPILVECKSFTWTSGGNSQSAVNPVHS